MVIWDEGLFGTLRATMQDVSPAKVVSTRRNTTTNQTLVLPSREITPCSLSPSVRNFDYSYGGKTNGRKD